MILSWALYAAAVGLLLAAAAWLLEHPLRDRGLPVRGPWIAALAATFLVPAAVAATRQRPPPGPPVYRFVPAAPMATPATVAEDLPAFDDLATPASGDAAAAGSDSLDRWLLAGWALASGVLALTFAGAAGSLRRQRRSWRRLEIDGRSLLVSADTGPAVVGALRGQVVVPDWLLHLPAAERELILRHEEEHVRAGDAPLLLLVLLLRVALPWNPALWWMGRALRRAVEVDCDRRVLASGADARVYARVLLDVTERGTAHRLAVAALSESQSFLERRIRLMFTNPRPLRTPRMAAAVTLALIAAVAACQMDQPETQPIVATGFSMGPAAAAAPPADSAAGAHADVPPVQQRLPALPQRELSDSIKATFRTILAAHHPEVISGAVRGERVNLYVALSGNGDVEASAVDREERSGNCYSILEAGLGITLERRDHAGSGCGRLDPGEAGPSTVNYFWRTSKPANEQERLAPTGPYLIDRLLQASRASPAQMTAAVREHFPQVYEEGLPQGETLWFVADRYHQVVHAGRGWEQATSMAAQAEIQREIPGIILDGGMTGGVRSAAGTPISIYWARLGDAASATAPSRPAPFPDAQIFAVSTPEPGREVEIRLDGEAASDPRAFRISGKFTNDDGVLRAITPFSFIVMTAAPYSATLRLQGEGEMQVETESDSRRSRFGGREVAILRTTEGAGPHIIAADAVVGPRPVADVIQR